MIKVAIDLLWVKHQQVGGIESYVRNLLDGFSSSVKDFLFILLVSKDNHNSFIEYLKDKRFNIIECPVFSTKLVSTVLWENSKLDKLISSLNVDFCFVPYYRCPIFPVKNKYIIVLHDLNALHFPQYFSRQKYLWLKFYWKFALNNAYKIVSISNFVKDDIVKQYRINENKLRMIYNPISNVNNLADFEKVSIKYDLNKYSYLYTVSSLHKHKNLITLLKMMKILHDKCDKCPKLVVSGISAGSQSELFDYIERNELNELCLFTKFIPADELYTLMKYCKVFLFSSVFEGFGMPLIEAKRLGAKVITTKCASIPEVTMNKLTYVEDPYNAEEWANLVINIDSIEQEELKFEQYDPCFVANQYYSLFDEILKQ